MLSVLYNIIILPLIQFFDFCFQFVFQATDSNGIAVIALSFIVTLCTLPLYMVAETWAEKERAIQNKMSYRLSRIKAAFSGDERYMMQTEYYRQNHYHPLMALRSSFTILIQVPFFIAAYNFLSNYEQLKGASLFFISNLGSADGIGKIGSYTINVLPIAMTVINCIAGFVYTSGGGYKKREKIQIYVLAIFFLILLYNSPSGLVVYWTVNNILSLVKNIFYKLKNPKKSLYIALCFFAIVFIVCPFTILREQKRFFRLAFLFFGVILPVIPFIVSAIVKCFDNHFKILDEKKELRFSVFIVSSIVLGVLCGYLIPSNVMQSEVDKYCFVDGYTSPFVFLFRAMWQGVGIFIFWPFVCYVLFSERVKKIFAVLFSICAIWAIINCFVFGGDYGPIYPELEFIDPAHFVPSLSSFMLNFFILLLSAFIFFVLLEKKPLFINLAMFVMLVSVGVVSITNTVKISSAYSKMTPPNYGKGLEPIFHLSKTGKNVMIIMQDSCVSPYIPYVFEECDGLDEKFDGFKWYPNTISLGRRTMDGAIGLYGGYDYTPFQVNLNEEKDVQTKNNESMLTLPILFAQNGYFAEISSFTYENFAEYPVHNMYIANPDLVANGIEIESYSNPDETPYVIKYKNHNTIRHNSIEGAYTDYWYANHKKNRGYYISTKIFRNFIWFSIFKIAPPIFRGGIYHDEFWHSAGKDDVDVRFVDSYSVHDYLPELTSFYDEELDGESANGTLVMFENSATHNSVLLQPPEYEYVDKVALTGNNSFESDPVCSTMCGVFKRFSEFIDYLKNNGVYDNTRIIIVSDHGLFIDGGELLESDKNFPENKTRSLSALMVKDFDAHGKFISARMTKANLEDGTLGIQGGIDMTFMTNADVPYLATKDLIPDAKNPFTRNLLKIENKNDYAIITCGPAKSTQFRHDNKFPIQDDEWYTVKDNIFISENWQPLYPEGRR